MCICGSNKTASIFVCLHIAINLKATKHTHTKTTTAKKRDHFHFEKTFKDSLTHFTRDNFFFLLFIISKNFQFSCLSAAERQTRDHNTGTVFTSFQRITKF